MADLCYDIAETKTMVQSNSFAITKQIFKNRPNCVRTSRKKIYSDVKQAYENISSGKCELKQGRYHFQRGSTLCMTIIMGICHYTLSKFLVQLDLDSQQKGSTLITSDADKWDRLCMCGAVVHREIFVLSSFFSVCRPYIYIHKKY